MSSDLSVNNVDSAVSPDAGQGADATAQFQSAVDNAKQADSSGNGGAEFDQLMSEAITQAGVFIGSTVIMPMIMDSMKDDG